MFLLLAFFALFFVACDGGGTGEGNDDNSSDPVAVDCNDPGISDAAWQNCQGQRQNGQTIDDCFPECLTPDASQVKSGEMPEEEIELKELLTDPAYEGSEGVLREGEN